MACLHCQNSRAGNIFEADLLTATTYNNRKFHLELNDKTVGSGTASNTKGWNNFTTTLTGIRLTSGTHKLKLVFDSSDLDVDRFRFVELDQKWKSGPVANQEFKTIWSHSRKGVPGTTVTLKGEFSPVKRWVAKGITNADGIVELKTPLSVNSYRSKFAHDEARKIINKSFKQEAENSRTVVLDRSTYVFGNVSFESGHQSVADAMVKILGQKQSIKIDKGGEFKFKADGSKKIRLIANLGEFSSYKNEKEIETINLVAHEDSGPVWLILKEGPLLKGVVVDDESKAPIAEAKVTVQGDRESYNTKTDASGEYQLVGVFADNILVSISADGYVEMSGRKINLALGKRKILNFELEKAGAVEFLAVDEREQPVEGVSFNKISNNHWTSVKGKTNPQGILIAKNISRKNPPKFQANKSKYTSERTKLVVFDENTTTASLKVVMKAYTPTESSTAEKALGLIVGNVKNEAGEAVAGATVAWARYYNTRNIKSEKQKTVTDEQGNYKLDATREHRDRILLVLAEGFAPAFEMSIIPGDAESPKTVDIILEKAHWLDIVVKNEAGEFIQGASISVAIPTAAMHRNLNLPGDSRNYTTDKNGFLRFDNLPGPMVNLTVNASKYTSTNKNTVKVDQQLEILLKPTGIMLGQVIDSTTKEPITEFKIKHSYDSQEQHFTNEEGRFKLTGLRLDSNITVTIDAEGYEAAYLKNIRAAREEKARERVIELSTEGEAIVEIFDAETEQPIPDDVVAIARLKPDYRNQSHRNINWERLSQDNNYQYDSFERKKTDPFGRITFSEGKSKKTLFINIYGYQRLYLDPAGRKKYLTEDGVWRISLGRGGTIQGVFSVAGLPHPNKKINVNYYQPNEYANLGGFTTDQNGYFEITGLAEGKYSLSSRNINTGDSAYSLTKSTTLAANEIKTIEFGEDLGTFALYGQVLMSGQPTGQCSVSLSSKDNWDYSFSASTNPEGRYRIEGLRAGKYNLSCNWYNQVDSQNLRLSEEIEINGDTEKNLEFGDVYSVRIKLVFPKELPSDERIKYQSGYLSWNYQAGSQRDQNIETHKQTPIVDDSLEFRGRFKGNYTLQLMYRTSGNSSTSFQIAQGLKLDNIEQDQDLGEIEVPVNGSIRFQFEFAKEENRELFTNVSLQRTDPLSAEETKNAITTHLNGALKNNEAVAYGRMKGVYAISLSGNNLSQPIGEKIQIDESGKHLDAGVISVPPINKIKMKLISKAPDALAEYTNITLTRKNDDSYDRQENSEALLFHVQTPLDDPQAVELSGRFRGSYTIALRGNNYRNTYTLPNPVEINNLEGDQDLG